MRRLLSLLTTVAALLASVSAASATPTVTMWPTCAPPPGGDYALCTQGAFPQSVTAAPDGAVWFTTARGNVGRATATGGITQFDVPGISGSAAAGTGLLTPAAIGPDGGLWFGSSEASGLWHGTISAAPTFGYTDGGLVDTQPRDVALGPDGALWVAQAKVASLGHLVPGGAETQIALPPMEPGAYVQSFDIVRGPDDRMWVGRTGFIDAVTAAGVVTAYPIGAHTADGIAVGPDGALWFTDYVHDAVGRITTAGVVTTFVLPTDSAPASITAGPDGALWIGLGKNQGIMRMTTAGAWTVTPLLFNSQVSAITTGPDDAIWFADLGGSRIGRLDLGTPVAATAAASPTTTVSDAAVSGSGVLTVAVRSNTIAPYVLSAAIQPSGAKARVARARTTLRIASAGSASGKLRRKGATTLKLKLSRAALKALRASGKRGARVEVGLKLALGGGQTSVGQRTVRLALHH